MNYMDELNGEGFDITYLRKAVKEFNKREKTRATLKHFADWLFGGELVEEFDAMFKKAVGDNLYDELETVNRVLDYFFYKYGNGPKVAGNIDLEKIEQAAK